MKTTEKNPFRTKQQFINGLKEDIVFKRSLAQIELSTTFHFPVFIWKSNKDLFGRLLFIAPNVPWANMCTKLYN